MDFSSMFIKWTKPNQDWTDPSVLSTVVHHSAEPCMRRLVQLSSACGRALPNSGGARAHVWAPSSANWGISSTSLAACSQLENHFLVDTHKNFSCFLLCQGKQAENLTKSLVVIPEKKCRFTKCVIIKYQWISRLFSDKIIEIILWKRGCTISKPVKQSCVRFKASQSANSATGPHLDIKQQYVSPFFQPPHFFEATSELSQLWRCI